MLLVLEKLSLTLRNITLFKQHIKNHFEEKILIQKEFIFSQKPNISLKIIKLTLSTFLENSKIYLKIGL
ncbi:putative phage integrase (plasmid) [Borreliella valaisiana VS116]|uniref:Putative phage integrase n=1 Tax=Borreliella valaisiana VS116 TaxID=445987 RepID=C0R9A4_BORVA|nr:putative phage integrase [Borreliella valaisiana VS116]